MRRQEGPASPRPPSFRWHRFPRPGAAPFGTAGRDSRASHPSRPKAGRPWRGIVKNRCKNGDHYWVDALVVPVRRDNETIGEVGEKAAEMKKTARQLRDLIGHFRYMP